MKIGDEIKMRIDESIRIYDKLLLVLSEHALASDGRTERFCSLFAWTTP
jgi:hypothetical protein